MSSLVLPHNSVSIDGLVVGGRECCLKNTKFVHTRRSDMLQARQTRQNSGGGGVAEGQPRFDKGGVAIFFKTFYAINILLVIVSTLSD